MPRNLMITRPPQRLTAVQAVEQLAAALYQRTGVAYINPAPATASLFYFPSIPEDRRADVLYGVQNYVSMEQVARDLIQHGGRDRRINSDVDVWGVACAYATAAEELMKFHGVPR